jgi:hypothetical protein
VAESGVRGVADVEEFAALGATPCSSARPSSAGDDPAAAVAQFRTAGACGPPGLHQR